MEPTTLRWNIDQYGYQSSIQPRRVAVIEDNPFWQYQIRQNLKSLDQTMDVKFLSSAEEFYNQPERPEDFDLIISDHFLGKGKTGLNLWQDLRDRHCEVPFALTSGFGKQEFASMAATDLGQLIFIEKPYKLEDFKNQINSVLAATPQLETFRIVDFDWTGAKEAAKLLAIAVSAGVVFTLCLSADVAFHKWLTQPQTSQLPARENIFDGRSVPGTQGTSAGAPTRAPIQIAGHFLPRELHAQMTRILNRADSINRLGR